MDYLSLWIDSDYKITDLQHLEYEQIKSLMGA
jgi:hypothetical protein